MPTKAETLSFLKGKLEHSRVADLMYFTHAEWTSNRLQKIEDVHAAFNGHMIIVRSSALNEDSETESLAGQFHSVLNIKASQAKEVAAAIDEVFASYGEECADNQVLIQPMIRSVILSGVAFTQDQKTGAPYVVISYDDESSDTDTITSGKGVSKSLRIWRGTNPDHLSSKRMRHVYAAIKELETVMGSDRLDIEFAVDDRYRVWTLQARPLICQEMMSAAQKEKLDAHLKSIGQEMTDLSKPQNDLYGRQTILGDMPDWNPAEMIGIQPSPLAYSLYRELITKEVWHKARTGMGYRSFSGAQELMVRLAGHPYIDTRKSFNSFLPAGVDTLTAERLVNAWLSRLTDKTQSHDKIEFDIVSTCYAPGFDAFMAQRYDDVLTYDQYQAYKMLLLKHTNDCVEGNVDYSITWSEKKALELKSIQQKTHYSDFTSGTPKEISAHIERLITECQTLGTIPFSAGARHAFIGEKILRDCLEFDVLTQDEVSAIKGSFPTISSDIIEGMMALSGNDQASKDQFYKNFGHIRPSSYDILSPRYDAMSSMDGISVAVPEHHNLILDKAFIVGKLDPYFKEIGYTFSASHFLDYYAKSVQMREWIKSVFTRHLSDILECVAAIGEHNGLDRKTMAYVPIDALIDVTKKDAGKEALLALVDEHRAIYDEYKGIYMNYLLESDKDLTVIPVQRSVPNFITYKRITAAAVTLSEKESVRDDLAGKIICIERADPGFDWLFGCNIGGLITKYGGANSHMAIRASEFSLPAAIGCGELIYSKLENAAKIDLDCESGQIISL